MLFKQQMNLNIFLILLKINLMLNSYFYLGLETDVPFATEHFLLLLYVLANGWFLIKAMNSTYRSIFLRVILRTEKSVITWKR